MGSKETESPINPERRFRVLVAYPIGRPVVVEDRITRERADRVKAALDPLFDDVVVEEMPSGTVSERRQALEALKATPEGRQEIEQIFRAVVMLPGEAIPRGLLIDHMISDIIDVEFRRM